MSETELPAPAERGTLHITSAALSHMASRAISDRSDSEMHPSVSVASVGPASIALAASLTLPYPSEPLAAVLNRLRDDVASDLALQTGKPVSRFDLRVDHFSLRSRRPARRVL